MSRPTNTSPLALAVAASLAIATTACSAPAPSTPGAAAAPSAAATSAEATPVDHSAMESATADAPMDPNAPMATATAVVDGAFGSGKPVTVTLQLVDMMGGEPMGPEAFELAHTQKIHALGVDPSLTDYSHSHPEPTAKPGEWTFAFTPKFNRPYHVWLDVKPIGGSHAYVMLTLNDKAAMAPVEKVSSLTAKSGDLTAQLNFDAPLIAGQAAMGHLQIKRAGSPFAALEPVMGAYSHIVGISEDWTTIAHVHPMGVEPTQASDRGGPSIDFHLEPQQAGFLKVFAQIQVDGKDVFLPFGVVVAAPATPAAAD